MVIPSDEIVYKNIIGKLGNKTVYGIGTCGGLHLIEARSADGKREVIGAGSHRAVARHIAKKNNPDIEYTMLEKSQEINLKDFEDVLPFWEAVTDRVKNKS